MEQKYSGGGQGADMVLIRMLYEHLCYVATQLQSICSMCFQNQRKYSAVVEDDGNYTTAVKGTRDLTTSRRTYHV